MGRHSSPDIFPAPPTRRLPGPRARPAGDRTIPGVRFPIVDDLSQIAADDRLLDYLAAGRSDFGDVFAGASGFADDRSRSSSVGASGFAGSVASSGSAATALPLAPLLATWRSEIVDPPLPQLPSIPAPRRVMRGPADKRATRSVKPILGVVAAIGALLLASAAVGAQSAQPGDALWGLTKVLYSSHAESVQAKIDVKNSMVVAKGFLASQNSQEAVKAVVPLSSADVQIKHVDPSDGQEGLQSDLDTLWTEVHIKTGRSVPASAVDASTSAAQAAGGPVAAASAKNSSGAAKQSASSAARSSTGAGATAGKPTVTSANGPSSPSGPATDGRLSPTVPGVILPVVPPTAPTVGNPSNPGTGTGAPAPSAPAVPGTDSATTPAGQDQPTSTTSQTPAPVTTETPTTSAPSATADPSTTSQMPSATATTADGGGVQQNNGPASVGNAPASQ